MTQSNQEWVFTHEKASRVAVPLFMGIVGPSSTGKTYSALRLATGMQRVTGGEIFGIDTESNRMKQYAPLPGQKADPARGKFDFTHVPFSSPYGPLRYLAAVEHCVKHGARVIVVDSMSHEHEGVGGVLEQHQQETVRLAAKFSSTEDAQKMSAWGVPKASRRRLINTLLTELKVNMIFCFRAKHKVKIASKADKQKDPRVDPVTAMGFCAIAGEEYIYEMLLKCLLLPGARGVPTWESDYPGERELIKIPGQLEHIFEKPAPLSEDIGQQLAEWAAGGEAKSPSDDELKAGLAAAKSAASHEEFGNVAESFKGKPWTAAQRKALKAALDARKAELSGDGQRGAA